MKVRKTVIVETEITEEETKKHLELLADAFFENLSYDGGCEFGSIGLDCKRPFGNSSVEIDILEIIGLVDDYDGYYNLSEETKEDYERYARELYCEKLPDFLKEKWRMYRSNW